MKTCSSLRRCLLTEAWRRYRRDIRSLPITSQVLFANRGLPWDVLEIELKDEGWLAMNEELWDALSNTERMRCCKGMTFEDIAYDEDWTEEDYLFYDRNKQ